MKKTAVAIHGAAGRMGRRLVALASADPELQLVAALEASGHPSLGRDAGLVAGAEAIDIPIADSWDCPVDAMIDFSVPDASEAITAACAAARLPLVVATTGLSQGQEVNLQQVARSIPVVWAPNMSLAVNLLMKLSEVAAHGLAGRTSPADVEIIEWHHRYKEDAPSGTALALGRIISDAMGLGKARHGRRGRPGPRPDDEIGYHAVRAGDHPGEHRVLFGMPGESIELRVAATSRDSYALGALAAARFVAGRPAGLYNMFDVLGL